MLSNWFHEILPRMTMTSDSAIEVPVRLFIIAAWFAGFYSIRRGFTRHKQTVTVLAGTTALAALALAWRVAWLSDDAHVSFRYAKNFAEGFGLVWNVGERVEGYTNFLWTMLLAVGEYLHVPSPYASLVLLAAWVIVFSFVAARLLTKTWPLAGPCIPLILLSPGFIEFTTSGLETVPAALSCAMAALLLLRLSTEAWAPVAVLIASLLRPDQALLFAPLGILALARGVRTRLFYATVAAGGAFGVYWLCRWSYYGALFPNTFYVKSGGLSYWSQGAFYLVLFAVCTGLGIALVLQVPRLARTAYAALRTMREPEAGPARALLFALGGMALLAVYTAKVGGDFMHLRFGVTLFGLAMIAGEVAYHLSPRWTPRSLPRIASLVASVLALGAPPEIRDGKVYLHNISHDRLYLPISHLIPLEVANSFFARAMSLKEYFASAKPGLASRAEAPMFAYTNVGMVGYYNPYLRVFDMLGLTSASVAHSQVTARGRPGHEKLATAEQILESGSTFTIEPWVLPIEFANQMRFTLNGYDYFLLRDDALTRNAFAPMSLPRIAPLLTRLIDGPATVSRGLLWWNVLRTMYRYAPEDLAEWRERLKTRFQLVEATSLDVRGASAVVRGDWQLRSEDSFEFAFPECPYGSTLRWRVEAGTCEVDRIDCDAPRSVRCSGRPAALFGFHLEKGE